CHSVHSFFVLSLYCSTLIFKCKKCASYFYNLHTLFYNLCIWGFYAWCNWYSDVEELYSYLENVPYLLYRIGEEWDDVENIDNDWQGSCSVEILREMQIDNRDATKIELEDLVTSLTT
ncbi:MAG: hypothetical protein UD936_04210, partial [Acutalibacteraceae bacterium]|nr:hypothetical protein [Acutalibacteraceae bacterium]